MPSKASVIIPTYNRENTIERAIDSVLEQTYDEFELIVVDDGSRDDTPAVVDQYSDSRISLIEHDKNKGGSAARNTGIQRSSGRFVSFLDSDDEWKPTKLEKQIQELQERSEDWQACYCDHEVIRTGYDAWLRSWASNLFNGGANAHVEGGAELIPSILLKRFSLGGASTLTIERPVLEELGGFDERFPRHQDLELLVRLLDQTNLALIPEKLVKKHETGRPSMSRMEEGQELFLSTFSDEIRRCGFEEEVYRVHRHDLGLSYIRNGEFRKGFRNISLRKLTKVYEALRIIYLFAKGLMQRTQVVNTDDISK